MRLVNTFNGGEVEVGDSLGAVLAKTAGWKAVSAGEAKPKAQPVKKTSSTVQSTDVKEG